MQRIYNVVEYFCRTMCCLCHESILTTEMLALGANFTRHLFEMVAEAELSGLKAVLCDVLKKLYPLGARKRTFCAARYHGDGEGKAKCRRGGRCNRLVR